MDLYDVIVFWFVCLETTGIRLHIYTPLITYDSIEHALEAQMAYSVGSVFFFGIIQAYL